MSNWRKIEAENMRGEWERILNSLPAASPFQNFEWAESYRELGWVPMYFGYFDADDRLSSAAIVLTRRLPLGIGFAWCPGGPVAESYGDALKMLPEAVKGAGEFRGLFFRGRFDTKLDIMDSLKLTALGWNRAIFAMGSNYSIELDLSEDEETLISRLSKGWKRNLRKSEAHELRVNREFSPDIEELTAIYEEMEKLKGTGPLVSRSKLEHLFERDHKSLIYLTCRDANNALLGFRSALIQGTKGVDYLSATTLEGRNELASYQICWELLRNCREAGVISYDMGGIDPVINPGVFQFKNGLGGQPVEFLGEWDWASSNWLRYAGNIFLARRQKPKTGISGQANSKRIWTGLRHAAARVSNF